MLVDSVAPPSESFVLRFAHALEPAVARAPSYVPAMAMGPRWLLISVSKLAAGWQCSTDGIAQHCSGEEGQCFDTEA